MASHICMHQLAEPLRAIVLPCLPPASLAALRGTCQAMRDLLDNGTRAIWLAAASSLFTKGAIDTLGRKPDAASIQAQLCAQAAAEAAVRTGGAQCGRVVMTHLLHVGSKAQVQKLEWSPCGSWVAVHIADGASGTLDVVPAMGTAGLNQAASQAEAMSLAGIPCTGFEWLGAAQGRLMVHLSGAGNANFISVYSAATGAKSGHSPSDEHEVIGVLGLSPCRTLLAFQEPCKTVGFAFSVWNPASDSCVQLQMPSAYCASCKLRVAWSHDSSFCAAVVGWQETRDSSYAWRFLIFTASGRLHQSLNLRPRACKWSPTASLLAFVADDTLKLWDISTATLTHIPVGLIGFPTTIAWSPDGNHLALSCPEGWIGAGTPIQYRINCILSLAESAGQVQQTSAIGIVLDLFVRKSPAGLAMVLCAWDNPASARRACFFPL